MIPDPTKALKALLQDLDRGYRRQREGEEMAKAKRAKAKKNGKPKVARTKKIVELHPCECGCGAQVTRHFKPGHDARLHGRLLKAAAKGDAKAKAELKQRGW